MARLNGRAAALVFSIFLLSLTALRPVIATSQEQPYSVTVRARCDIEGNDPAAGILLDGTDSGFSTPHKFIGLTGYHNFSVNNEHAGGHFITGPPKLQGNPDASFGLLSEGVNWIIIGSPTTSEVTIEFSYGSVPFIENLRNTFAPGTVAEVGVRVHMDPSRTVIGHIDVYDHEPPLDATKTPPFFSSDITIHGNDPTFVQFEIPNDGPTGSWPYKIVIKDSTFNVSINTSFDVAFPPTLTPAAFPSFETLPHSTLDIDGSRYAFFNNPHASAAVLYVGGGNIGTDNGPTPINGYSNATDQNSASYRLVYDLVTHGFSVVIPEGRWQGLDFPTHVVDYLRGQGWNKFYAIGHSAGGVVIASSIINHPELFGKAVIADAPLTQESTGFYFTDLSIRSESVSIPQLLIWGRGDSHAKLENAYAWMDHANQSLATLKVYDYDHDWADTTAEAPAREEIISFLTGNPTSVLSSKVATGELAALPILKGIGDLESNYDIHVIGDFQNTVAKTKFGSSLITGLSMWQPILGLTMRQLLANDPRVGHTATLILYPATLVLKTGTLTFSIFGAEAEMGAAAAIIVVCSLFGATYLGFPLAVVLSRSSRTQRRLVRNLGKLCAAALFSSLPAVIVAEAFGLAALLACAATTTVFASLTASALFSSRLLLTFARPE